MFKYLYTQSSIPNELCDEIIFNFENENITNKYEGITISGLNKKIKNTTDFVISSNNEIWNKIHSFLEKELHNNLIIYTTNLHIDKPFLIHSIFMMQKYVKNEGLFTYHHDFNVKDNNYRVITFIWYLNDVDEGGETEIIGKYKIKPEKGKILLFPADWCSVHCGKIPISNDKYIITGWLYYPKNL